MEDLLIRSNKNKTKRKKTHTRQKQRKHLTSQTGKNWDKDEFSKQIQIRRKKQQENILGMGNRTGGTTIHQESLLN